MSKGWQSECRHTILVVLLFFLPEDFPVEIILFLKTLLKI
jgi:hypothetical protein